MTWSLPEILSMQAIEADLWDRREHQRATKGLRRYSRARNQLFKVARTGPDALVDAFMVLVKANPHLLGRHEMQPGHYVNRLVISELQALSATRRLRAHTVGDHTQAALGCITLAPILESIFERLKLQQDLAEEIQRRLVALHEHLKDLADQQEAFDAMVGTEPTDEDIEAALAAADELREAAGKSERMQDELDAMTETLLDQLDDESDAVRAELQEAMAAMADETDDTVSTAKAWGVTPGELRQLPAAARLALAKKLNNERMRQIADLFGRIRNLSFMDAATATDATRDEIIDLELGDDLGRVVPSELLMLGDPDTEMDFFSRWSERELVQYSVQGTDELGRGGIVICIDGSGSMHGSREMWAKAVMLNLLHAARAQHREMHVIHFGGPGEYKHMAFTTPASFTADRIIDAAGAYFGGGTDFQTPMAVALKTLIDEHGRTGAVRADVVFVTDDECAVREQFMEQYLDEMHRIGARTFGLAVDGHRPNPNGSLVAMCEGRVATVADLASGRDVRSMLRAITQR